MFNVVIAVNPSEHSLVACLWAFKRILVPGKNKGFVLLVTGYSREKYIIPFTSSYSSIAGQNTPSHVFEESVKSQLNESFPMHKAGTDYEIESDNGCPVEKIKNKVLENDAFVLIMGEKHPLNKRGTLWSNTVYSCILNCPCIILVVRPTCFDIVDTDPLIEIFRHPSFTGNWPFFDFTANSQEMSNKPTPVSIPTGTSAAISSEQKEIPIEKPKEKKNFFGKLLQTKTEVKHGEEAVRKDASLEASDKIKFVGMEKKSQKDRPGSTYNEDSSRNAIEKEFPKKELSQRKEDDYSRKNNGDSSYKVGNEANGKDVATSYESQKKIYNQNNISETMTSTEKHQDKNNSSFKAIPKDFDNEARQDSAIHQAVQSKSNDNSQQRINNVSNSANQQSDVNLTNANISNEVSVNNDGFNENMTKVEESSKPNNLKSDTGEIKSTETDKTIHSENVVTNDDNKNSSVAEQKQKEKKSLFKNIFSKEKQPNNIENSTEKAASESKKQTSYNIKDSDMKHFAGPSKKSQ